MIPTRKLRPLQQAWCTWASSMATSRTWRALAYAEATPSRRHDRSWTPEKSQIESQKHQDNADIHRQPFGESILEERDIHADYDDCHRYQIEHDDHRSVHFSSPPFVPSTTVGY
jgi:hypothetical protein